jgi:hypothetical protein
LPDGLNPEGIEVLADVVALDAVFGGFACRCAREFAQALDAAVDQPAI